MPELLGASEVARRLGVNIRFVRRLVAERRITYFKVGHLVRFDPADLDEWIARSRVDAFVPGPPRSRQR